MNILYPAHRIEDLRVGIAKAPRAVGEWLHLLSMMAVAWYFRFPGLGTLSLYGDEDYSAFAVQAILVDGFPHMPSGMAYWRSAPYSYVAALSAHLFGLTEFSLRLPSVLFGVISVPVFYYLARRLVGVLPASLAAWLLVFSAWHIDMSREGRMYAMFLALTLLSLLCFQKGFVERRPHFKLLAVFLGVVSLMAHELGILLLVLWCISLFTDWRRWSPRERLLLLVVVLGLLSFWIAYGRFSALVPTATLPGMAPTKAGSWLALLKPFQLSFTPKFWMLSHILAHHAALFIALLSISSVLFYRNWRRHKDHSDTHLVIGSGVLVALALVNLFGLISATLLFLLLLGGQGIRGFFHTRYCRRTIIHLTSIFVFWSAYGLVFWRGAGITTRSEVDLARKILKDSLYYPALHILPYLDAFPLMTVVVILGTLAWTLIYHRGPGAGQPHAVVFTWFWLPLLILGVKAEWIYLRYTVTLYPFYLMIFAWTLHELLRALQTAIPRPSPAVSGRAPASSPLATIILSATLLIIPLINEQHSVRAASATSRLAYAQSISPIWHGFPFHPDHKGAGEYVKAHLQANDIVIAMDVFEQYYYVGRVDYWLTADTTRDRYSHRDGPAWYDIYTRTRVVTGREELENLLNHGSAHRVWLITSGELAPQLETLFSPGVRDILSRSDSKVVFVGRDHATRVYRFGQSA